MPKPIRPRRHIDATSHLNWLLAVFVLPVLVWVGLGIYNEVNQAYWNGQYIKLGKAVDCQKRPNPSYLTCLPSVDGPACAYNTSSPLQIWYAPIDFACAQYEPERVFVFEVREPLEGVEIASAN